MTVELSEVPSDPDELEDYVAALFQCAGYFVEQNIKESDRNEQGTLHVLEMDVVATSYAEDPPLTVIAEGKSGDWGLADVFKLLGWLTYLGLDRGGFFVRRDWHKEKEELIRERFSRFSTCVVSIGRERDDFTAFEKAGFGTVRNAAIFDHWRFVFRAMRRLTAELGSAIKSNVAADGARAAKKYHSIVNDELFFEPDVKKRLSRLYAEFGNHPKLARAVANELEGNSFTGDATAAAHKRFSNALFEGADPLIQAALFVEHRARLAILRTAVDYMLAGEPSADEIFDVLPSTFRKGFQVLKSEHEFFRHYPTVWQIFLWGLGGFYLNDRKDFEFAHLAELSGLPICEIPRALTAFDILFPMQGNKAWLVSPRTASCTVVLTFPMPLRGLGANYRKILYGAKEYGEFKYSDRTLDDLGRWHNCGYNLLKGVEAQCETI